ncbi:hypothetical protein cyc_02505 [Cyclospora cayetanensis]|uniref:Uncharacterized protein n=1 Tax=Cyclospora cayetanensis TaxID=88456 RepID=A0A1D3D0W0_9EIME|nr:hypothetical protein cyc_02505 [Cyclospora cayetanensis]
MSADPKSPLPETPRLEGALHGITEAVQGPSNTTDGDFLKRKAPEHIVVGEIRQNLDDLKAAVLSYYSRLYSLAGRSINERLDRLAAPPFSNKASTRLPLARGSRSTSKKHQGLSVPPPDTCFDFFAEEHQGSKEPKDGDLVSKAEDPSLQRRFYGISQLPGEKIDREMVGHDNFLGRQLKETRGGHINELLGDLRSKCSAATSRLNLIGDQLERECEDPNLREWEYTTLPQVCQSPLFFYKEFVSNDDAGFTLPQIAAPTAKRSL